MSSADESKFYNYTYLILFCIFHLIKLSMPSRSLYFDCAVNLYTKISVYILGKKCLHRRHSFRI